MAEAKKTVKSKTQKVRSLEGAPKTTAKKITKNANQEPRSPKQAKPKDSVVVEADRDSEFVIRDSGDASTSSAQPAKAGRRSAKALKEAEEKQAKEERKVESSKSKTETVHKKTQKPARTRLERRGKKFRKLAELIDTSKQYDLKEAVELAIKTSPVKFDASAELHIRLNVDPKQADQNIRGSLVLPHGTGKTLRVAVFAEPDDAAKATKAGADVAGSDEITALLEKSQMPFDVLIATPAAMPKLGRYARLLGPKGLMPNPKSGTVSTNVTKAVTEAKAGRVEYRVDSTGIVHLAFGKVSFGPDKLVSNAQAILASLKGAKPASVKGAFVKTIFLTTTMGPGIQLSTELG